MKHWLRLTFLHLRFASLSFWRNPSAAFFSMVFPLMFLTINSLLLGHNQIPIAGKMVSLSSYYVASLSVFAVIMTGFTNLATSILFDRDQGRLKRLRGTPTPVSSYIAARIILSIGIGVLTSGLCLSVGTLFFNVHPIFYALPTFFLVLVLGSATLSALALALVGIIPNAQAGPAILNALTFPILFISSIFYPLQGAPKWVIMLANVLPVRPLANAAVSAYFGLEVSSHDLVTLAAWGVAGSLVAGLFFKWQPSR